MEKLYTLKTFLKMVGGRGFASGHSYKNYQKSLSYFSHLAPLFCSSLLIGKVKKEEGPWHNTPPKYASANRIRCALSRALFLTHD